ncbi:hypothetical protein APHAL10511_008391 [Amanita phalloides]|nr:hypothetical protein APHAL10511_008391 [Amanita phalloides]
MVMVDGSITDEEAPLLHPERAQKPFKQAPFPWLQFSTLFLLQQSEYLTETTTYPFMPDLVRNLEIVHGDEKNVGYYVGMLQTAYHLAATVTVFHCCWLSDQIGRRPVLLTGVLGLSICMCVFGLSTMFWTLLLCQLLIGAFNGTTGVIKSMVVEITDSTNVARAWGYIMVGWFVASSLGPAIGGSLSRPADQFPQLFGSSEFFKKHAYFLPCAVCSAFLFMTWMFGFAALKETKEKSISVFPVKRKIRKDTQPLEVQEEENGTNEPPIPLRAILTPKVISAAVNYGALSIVFRAYSAIHPVFLSTPIPDGGLGLAPRAIGTILSVIAIFTGLCQIFIFPRMHNKLGSRNVFILGMLAAFPTFILWPIMNRIAKAGGYSGFLWFTLALQGVCTIVTQLGFGAVLILIAESPRDRASLGATMGFCQLVANVVRAVGPGIFNSLFSLSVDNGYLGGQLVYVVTICIASIALCMASWSPQDCDR